MAGRRVAAPLASVSDAVGALGSPGIERSSALTDVAVDGVRGMPGLACDQPNARALTREAQDHVHGFGGKGVHACAPNLSRCGLT